MAEFDLQPADQFDLQPADGGFDLQPADGGGVRTADRSGIASVPGFGDVVVPSLSELGSQYKEFGRSAASTLGKVGLGLLEMLGQGGDARSSYGPPTGNDGFATAREALNRALPTGGGQADPMSTFGGQMAATALPAMAAPAAYAPAVGAAIGGGLGYTNARERGATPTEALGSAAINAGVNAAVAKIPHATSLPRALLTAYAAPKAGELANFAYERATYDPNAPAPQAFSEQDLVNTAVGGLAYAGPRIPGLLTARRDMLNNRAEQARAMEFERQLRVGNEFEAQQRAAEQAAASKAIADQYNTPTDGRKSVVGPKFTTPTETTQIDPLTGDPVQVKVGGPKMENVVGPESQPVEGATPPESPQSRQEAAYDVPSQQPPKNMVEAYKPYTGDPSLESAYATADEVSAAMAAEGVTPEQASASIAKLQEARNAANERVKPEGNLGQRQGTDTGGARTAAGDSNSPAAGGQAEVGQQGQGQDVGLFGQTPTPKSPKGVRNRGFVDTGAVADAVGPVVDKGVEAAKGVAKAVDNVLSRYSESLAPRIAAMGGAEAKAYARDALRHENTVKKLMGDVSPQLDPALNVASRASAFTKWANSDSTGKGYYGINNWVRAAEGKMPVPENFVPDQTIVDTGNRAIGKMAEGTLFDKATGKVQRMPTPEHMAIMLEPNNPNRETLIKAKADAGKVPESVIRAQMDEIKTLADQNDYEGAYRRVSQEFNRGLDEVPSWIKGKSGERIELYHHQASDYLRNASTRVAARVAYRQIFGDDAVANARRQKVMAELPSANADEVTRLSRAMHGLAEPNQTVDTLSKDVANIKGRRAAQSVMSVMSGLNLGLSAIGNATEVVTGVAPRTLGYKTMAQAAANIARDYRKTQTANEVAGNINRNIYDWSGNQNRPIGTWVKRIINGERIANATTALNEFTGLLNAEAGRITTENMKAGKLATGGEGVRIGELAKQMGFTPDEARAMVAGKASPELYAEFGRKFPSFVTGENKLLSEGSRFSTNRVASTLFRFQNYPIIQLNALRKAALGIVAKGQTPAERRANVGLLARHVAGLTAGGAAANLLMAFTTGGEDKLRTRMHEGMDQPLAFLAGSFARGLGGLPVTLATEAVTGGNLEDMGKALFKSSNPLTNVSEVWDALAGKGRYTGMDRSERAKELLLSVNPAFKAGRFWLGTKIYGEDQSLQNAASAVRRFKATEGLAGSGSGSDNESAQRFRHSMAKVAQLGTTIGKQDPNKVLSEMQGHILAAMGEKAKEGKDPYQSVAQSLLGKRVLTGLNDQQLQALRKRVGDQTFRDALAHDAALKAMADSFN